MITQTLSAVATSPTHGQLCMVDVNYTATNPDVTGIGFRLFYASKKLVFQGFSNILGTNYIGLQEQDVINVNLPSQDKSLLGAWADWGGSWPGVTSVRLFTATFLVTTGWTGYTQLNFVPVSVPPNCVLVAPAFKITPA